MKYVFSLLALLTVTAAGMVHAQDKPNILVIWGPKFGLRTWPPEEKWAEF